MFLLKGKQEDCPRIIDSTLDSTRIGALNLPPGSDDLKFYEKQKAYVNVLLHKLSQQFRESAFWILQ